MLHHRLLYLVEVPHFFVVVAFVMTVVRIHRRRRSDERDGTKADEAEDYVPAIREQYCSS